MPSSDSPFATPPSVEAALARTPAAPATTGGSGVSPDRLEVSASAIARFREVLALHEDIQNDFAASATSLSVAATPILAAPVAPPAHEAGSMPEASASGATRETLAAAASATLAQASALESSAASLAAAIPPATRETLAAAASATLTQSAAFTDSANTLVALSQPIATAAIPHAESPEVPAAPIVPHAEVRTAPVVSHAESAKFAEIPAATREAGSVPEASASGFTRETLAAAASATLAEASALESSAASLAAAVPPATRETLAVAASATLAQASALESSAASLAAAVPPATRETLAAAASATLTQSAAFTDSANTLVALTQPIATAAIPHAESPEAPAAPVVPHAESAKFAEIPTATREAGSEPEASASGATRETLAAAASATLAAAVPPATRETLAAAASATLAQSAAFTDSANTLVELTQPIATAAIPHTESPKVPAAPVVPHAEAPVAPVVPHAESAKFAEGQIVPVVPHAEIPAATREAGSVPEASASGATRETLAVAASATLAQASALESSAASLAAAVPPPTRETLVAAASATLAQSAAFTDSANTLVALAQPIANTAIPHAESPEVPTAPVVPHAESQIAPVVPHAESAKFAEIPAATREAGSVPEASASGFTRDSLAAAASSALAQTGDLARSTAAFQTAAAPVLNATSPETLAAAASATVAQAAVFEASAATLTTAAIPFVAAATTPVVETTAPAERIVPLPPEQVDALAPTLTFTSSDGTTLPYRLYLPSPSSETPPSSLPLVLFMHGAGTRGSDGAALANNISFRSILGWATTHKPAIVLAPQCPAAEQWVDTPWGDVKHTYSPVPPPHTAAALELLDKTLASLPVDRSRILVCGNSMGGYATWDILVRRPGLFAAALPVCGGGVPELTAESGRDVAVWAFHGDADPTVPVENTRAMVDALRADPARTAEIRYREYPGVSHDSWTATFSDPEVLTWFFDQRRPLPATAAQATEPQPSLSPLTSSLPAAPSPEDDPTKAAAAIQAAPLPVPPQVDSSLVTRHSSLTEAATPASVVRAAFEPAVQAVAEAIQISPDLTTKGEGEIRIQLKPAVLDGSAVQISVSGNNMSIVFTPATPDVAALLQAHSPELATLLAERVPAWHATVAVRGEPGRRSKE